jgi:hypothetical protein
MLHGALNTLNLDHPDEPVGYVADYRARIAEVHRELAEFGDPRELGQGFDRAIAKACSQAHWFQRAVDDYLSQRHPLSSAQRKEWRLWLLDIYQQQLQQQRALQQLRLDHGDLLDQGGGREAWWRQLKLAETDHRLQMAVGGLLHPNMSLHMLKSLALELQQWQKEQQRDPGAPLWLPNGQFQPQAFREERALINHEPTLPPAFRNRPELWAIPGYRPTTFRWVWPEQLESLGHRPRAQASSEEQLLQRSLVHRG